MAGPAIRTEIQESRTFRPGQRHNGQAHLKKHSPPALSSTTISMSSTKRARVSSASLEGDAL